MNVILQMDQSFKYGENISKMLLKNIKYDRPLMHEHDVGILTQMVSYCEGDHLEIGSAFGASAITASLAMGFRKIEGRVVCIDPMEGDLSYAPLDTFWENVKVFEVENRIEFHQQKSQPYPLGDRKFGSALIDGDHSTECVIEDWKNVSKVTLSHIMIHDYGQIYTVRKAVREVVLPDENWDVSHVCGWSLVMKRIKW